MAKTSDNRLDAMKNGITLLKDRNLLVFVDLIYRSIIHKFEVLSGKEFSSKVFTSAAYKSVKDALIATKEEPGECMELMKKIIKLTNNGDVVSCKIDNNVGGVVQIKGSTEAISYGPSEIGVCYLTQGIIRAFMEVMTNKTVDVKERKCISMGGDVCEFAVTVI